MTTAWLAALIVAGWGQTGVKPGSDPGLTPRAPESTLTIGGAVAIVADVLPREDAAEARPQILVDFTGRRGQWLRYRAEVLVEGLAAHRDGGAATDFVARPRDAWVEVGGAHGDLRAGYGRLVWGRLDEIQPSDVINPLDTAKFLLDGRSAARLPVGFIRGRVMPSERLIFEADPVIIGEDHAFIAARIL